MASELSLIEVQKVDIAAVFKDGGSKDILERIETLARSQARDISTVQGRKDVASLGYTIARSKTFLDDQGKVLVDRQKREIAIVDAQRKCIRDRLDALKSEVRKELDEWEEAEDQRVMNLEFLVSQMGRCPERPIQSSEDAAACFEWLEKTYNRDWQEFAYKAADAYGAANGRLLKAVEDVEKREEEAAELARLRAEDAARKQRERDEKIAREAAEKAKRDAELVVQRERDRVAAEVRRAAEEKSRREADEAHRASVKQAVVDAFEEDMGFDWSLALAVFDAIERGDIPHVTINY